LAKPPEARRAVLPNRPTALPEHPLPEQINRTMNESVRK
jgi:hypothetical protein